MTDLSQSTKSKGKKALNAPYTTLRSEREGIAIHGRHGQSAYAGKFAPTVTHSITIPETCTYETFVW